MITASNGIGRAHPIVREAILAPLRTPEIDAILAESEDRFRAGERFVEEGDAALAREQFDEAIALLLTAPADAYDRRRAEQKCLELVDSIYLLDVGALLPSPDDPGADPSPLDDILAATFPVDPNLDLTVIDKLKLPVSELPLEVNSEVMRYIKYFSSGGGRKVLVEGMRLMGRYRPMIERILAEEGVPRELIYLAQIESGFKPRAVSRARASGMWQFMLFRGREYGLHRTTQYDDRYDPEKATRAAARHLRDLYERLGDWYLAMAAYNAGPGRIDLGVRRTGFADYWELSRRNALPRETRRFVPVILATIIMAKNPEEYGLEAVVPDPPVEYNTIQVTSDTHLGLIADILGRTLAELRDLNPAILRDVAPAGYQVHVPKGSGSFVMAALETVPPGRRHTWRVHRVGYGETIAEIASRYRTTAEMISVANGGVIEAPEAGDLLVVPVSYSRQ